MENDVVRERLINIQIYNNTTQQQQKKQWDYLQSLLFKEIILSSQDLFEYMIKTLSTN